MASAAPLPFPVGPPVPVELPVPGQTYVTPDAPQGFTQPDTRAPGTAQISSELGAPPMGNADALVLKTPDSDAKATFFTAQLNGPLAPFLSSSYYAKRDASSTGSAIQFPSFQISVDKNGGTLERGDFSTLTFEPIYQTGTNANTGSGTWNRYDTGVGLFCSTSQIGGFAANQTRCENGGLKTLEEINAANPDLTVIGAGINQGSGNPGIIGGVDLFQVGGTTYNFEQKAPLPPVVPEPEEPTTPEEPGCVPKPEDPGTGTPGPEHPGNGHPGHPQPGNDHPGEDWHPDGGGHPVDDGSWSGDEEPEDGGQPGEQPEHDDDWYPENTQVCET